MTSSLDRLSAGTLDWLGAGLDHFDPCAAGRRAATHRQAKAVLELALLCHCSARTGGPHGERLHGATALLRKLWQNPDFPRLFDTHPPSAPTYRLVFAALAPDGIDDTLRRATLARLGPDSLSPAGKSPLKRMETRFYADKAGADHTIEPYAELVGLSPLVTLPAQARADVSRGDAAGEAPSVESEAPLSDSEGYSLTHAAFFLGDYGHTATGLSEEALAPLRDLVRRMLDHCVEQERWDLAAELVITQYILGQEPLRTPSGAAAVACLARAQRSDGAIPGRSAALMASPSAPPAEFFTKAYHTTLVTALMTIVLSTGRP
ncbi:hypothetical protein KME66_05435 [Streptomyces sp. YPW6]|uniref:DUF6895 family protein n=1 Tax=unclassified Streptomyces TaxID=2593676 RepID=UPI001C0CE8C4|nr:hypothetical protein [Streptomyces sp. YPW6]QWQ40521.1 hypothetical protein KME66_05435 [Streptomyces sp. YPW6]